MDRLGAEATRTYNHDLVVRGAGLFFERFAPDLSLPEAMTAGMALVPLPLNLPTGKAQADAVRDTLLFEHNIEVPVISWGERLWARTAAQVYCEMSDFERLAETVSALKTG